MLQIRRDFSFGIWSTLFISCFLIILIYESNTIKNEKKGGKKDHKLKLFYDRMDTRCLNKKQAYSLLEIPELSSGHLQLRFRKFTVVARNVMSPLRIKKTKKAVLDTAAASSSTRRGRETVAVCFNSSEMKS